MTMDVGLYYQGVAMGERKPVTTLQHEPPHRPRCESLVNLAKTVVCRSGSGYCMHPFEKIAKDQDERGGLGSNVPEQKASGNAVGASLHVLPQTDRIGSKRYRRNDQTEATKSCSAGRGRHEVTTKRWKRAGSGLACQTSGPPWGLWGGTAQPPSCFLAQRWSGCGSGSQIQLHVHSHVHSPSVPVQFSSNSRKPRRPPHFRCRRVFDIAKLVSWKC